MVVSKLSLKKMIRVTGRLYFRVDAVSFENREVARAKFLRQFEWALSWLRDKLDMQLLLSVTFQEPQQRGVELERENLVQVFIPGLKQLEGVSPVLFEGVIEAIANALIQLGWAPATIFSE